MQRKLHADEDPDTAEKQAVLRKAAPGSGTRCLLPEGRLTPQPQRRHQNNTRLRSRCKVQEWYPGFPQENGFSDHRAEKPATKQLAATQHKAKFD
ncbi:hypothetical protein SKAU_G00374820 [Synaphobranchus kaupii]|uniref:Uncharacterized protein n=1 Tax=Synaphobranchus kaupii TaxID=118154 RepID=A0A9Q1EGR5_SYNKA|nr:hypothetical protein SKAU_G00374820 [Synaphobranchus kaupii]